MPTCDDLRLGGTLSSSGITGGVAINNTGIGVEDWSSLLGTAGITGQSVEVFGRPGGFLAGDRLGQPRFPTLNMYLTGWDRMGGSTWIDTQLQDNTDDFLALVANPAGQYLEVDMADATSRFLYVYNLDPAPIAQPRQVRTMSVPLMSPMPYWKEGGTEDTDTISGADTIVVGGNANVYDPVLVFSGDGTFQHTGLGWEIEVVGSGGAVTVDLSTSPITVTEGGNPANNLVRRNNRSWGWFTPGNNAVTASVSVTVTWRSSWQ